MSIIINLDVDYSQFTTDNEVTYLSSMNELINSYRNFSKKDLKANYHKFDEAVLKFVKEIYIKPNYCYSVIKNLTAYFQNRSYILENIDLEFLYQLLLNMEDKNITLLVEYHQLLSNINYLLDYNRDFSKKLLPSIDGNIKSFEDLATLYIDILLKNKKVNPYLEGLSKETKAVYSILCMGMDTYRNNNSIASNVRVLESLVFISSMSIGNKQCIYDEANQGKTYVGISTKSLKLFSDALKRSNSESDFSINSPLIIELFNKCKDKLNLIDRLAHSIADTGFLKQVAIISGIEVGDLYLHQDLNILINGLENIILNLDDNMLAKFYKTIKNVSSTQLTTSHTNKDSTKTFKAKSLWKFIEEDNNFMQTKRMKKIHMEYMLENN